MENDLILWKGRLFPNIKAKEETVTAVENLFIFFCFSLLTGLYKIFQYISRPLPLS